MMANEIWATGLYCPTDTVRAWLDQWAESGIGGGGVVLTAISDVESLVDSLEVLHARQNYWGIITLDQASRLIAQGYRSEIRTTVRLAQGLGIEQLFSGAIYDQAAAHPIYDFRSRDANRALSQQALDKLIELAESGVRVIDSFCLAETVLVSLAMLGRFRIVNSASALGQRITAAGSIGGAHPANAHPWQIKLILRSQGFFGLSYRMAQLWGRRPSVKATRPQALAVHLNALWRLCGANLGLAHDYHSPPLSGREGTSWQSDPLDEGVESASDGQADLRQCLTDLEWPAKRIDQVLGQNLQRWSQEVQAENGRGSTGAA